MMNKKHKNAVKVEIPEYQTIREIVFEGTARGGNNKQFMFLDRNKQLQECNYNETFYRIRTLSTYFYSKGLKNGKKIAIVSENLIDWGFAYYAIIVGGNVCVPMDAKLSYEDIEDQIIRCDCDAVVYSKKFSKFVEQIKANSEVPQMEYFFMDDFDTYYAEGEKMIEAGDDTFDTIEIKPDDLAAIVFTSGTTGKSKGVMLTHKNVASNCSASLRVLTGRHAIAFLPLHHTLSWVSGLYATYIVSEWGYLCDSLKDRISYFYTTYRKAHDHYGRASINLDKNEILNCEWTVMAKQWYDICEQEAKMPPHPSALEDYDASLQRYNEACDITAREKWMPEGTLCETDFIYSASAYVNTDISEALESENYLLRVFDSRPQ